MNPLCDFVSRPCRARAWTSLYKENACAKPATAVPEYSFSRQRFRLEQMTSKRLVPFTANWAMPTSTFRTMTRPLSTINTTSILQGKGDYWKQDFLFFRMIVLKCCAIFFRNVSNAYLWHFLHGNIAFFVSIANSFWKSESMITRPLLKLVNIFTRCATAPLTAIRLDMKRELALWSGPPTDSAWDGIQPRNSL